MYRFVFHFAPVLVLLLASADVEVDTFLMDFHWSRNKTLVTVHYGWPQPILEVHREEYRRTTIYPSAKLPPNSTTTRWIWHGVLTNVTVIVIAIAVCWRSWVIRDRDRLFSSQWNVGTLFTVVTVCAILIGLVRAGFRIPLADASVPWPQWLGTDGVSAVLCLLGWYCVAVILWRLLAIMPGLLNTSVSRIVHGGRPNSVPLVGTLPLIATLTSIDE